MATDQELEIDRAALLFATAQAVEPAEAVEAAANALGSEGLATTVPLLQPAALGTSSLLGRRERQQMEALRREAALASGIDNPEPAAIQRVSFGTLAMAAGAFIGIWLLAAQLTGLSDLRGTIANAQWGWVILAFVISQLAVVANAFAMTGSVAATIPLGPLVLLRMGYTFIGLIAGSAGVAAMLIRFYQKRGIPAVAAVSAGVFFGLAGFSCQIVLTTIGLITAGSEFNFAHHGRGTGSTALNVVLICVIAVGVVAIVLTAFPRLRRSMLGRLRPQAALALSNLRAITSQPGKLARLFSGEAANQLLLAVALGASVRAFGGSVSFGALLVVNSLVSVIGGMAPIPGGMGVMEAGYIAGLEGAGVSQAVAVAATLTFRLATTYLPPIWGWFAFNALRRRDEL